MNKPVFILNGPNLNLLGTRQPEVYGSTTLSDIERICADTAKSLGLATDFRQSNSEDELVSWIQEARDAAAAIVINAAAYTHTSVAILDALLATDLPIVEVHLSNIHKRETFRHHSFVSKAATGVICGLGVQGYQLSLQAVAALLEAAEGQ